MNCSRLIAGGRWLVRQICTAAAELAESKAEHSATKFSLYRKLSALNMTGGTVSETLNQCITERKRLSKHELLACIKRLRKHRDFQQALEIMEWMELRGVTFSKVDSAVYLDLVSLTKGLVAADSYFSGLPPRAKNKFTYSALLNCYCRDLMKDKALALFEKMDELNYFASDLPFCSLMSLYMRLGEPEKVPPLIDDLKRRNISMTASTYTYHIWMNSYASLNDIEAVERVYEEMKEEDEDKINWRTHGNLAAIYVKAKLFEKAESELKMLEKMVITEQREAYSFLLSLYAGTGNRAEVYRVWNSLKSVSPVTNMSYLTMLQSLARLNDIEGLIKCFKEWESSCITYDSRLARPVIKAYLSLGLWEEASLVLEEAIKRMQGKGSFYKIHEMFILFFLERRKEDLAVRHLEAALSKVKDHDRRWPSPKVVNAFLEYYEEEKVDGIEKLRQILKTCNFDDNCLRDIKGEEDGE